MWIYKLWVGVLREDRVPHDYDCRTNHHYVYQSAHVLLSCLGTILADT